MNVNKYDVCDLSVLVKRRMMTLLEIMIVIAVIAIAAGTIGFGVNKAIVNQQFQTELSVLVDELRLAQNLMLILGTDVHVKFKQVSNKKIEYWLETETELPASMANEILRKHHELKVIKAISFKDNISAKPKEGELDLQFLSHGSVMSQGIITLATTDKMPPPENVLQGYICLAGYPRPISSFPTYDAAKKECEISRDEQFDKELTQDTVIYEEDAVVRPDEVKKEDQSGPVKVKVTKMIRCTRRYSLLLEVLISFVIVVMCILPLLYPHVFILKAQQDMIKTVELDHIVNLVYGNILEKLYLNEIPWDTLESKKKIPIDAELVKSCGFGCPTPYTGTYQFSEIKHKPKTIKDKALYLYKLTFEFTKNNGKDKKDYEYQVLVERKVPE